MNARALPDTRVLLEKYVRPDQPFGPPDAAVVAEPECAAMLFDWNNNNFAEMLSGSDVFMGRRGSGKSSLLRSFQARMHLLRQIASEGDDARAFRDRHHISAKMLQRLPRLVIDVDTPEEVGKLENHCASLPICPSVEVIARMWRNRIWLLIGLRIANGNNGIWARLPDAANDYIQNRDIDEIASNGPHARDALTPERYTQLMEEYLRINDIHIVVTFDNIEKHQFEPVQNAVLGGLIAATGDFINAQHPSIDIKLCLPAELGRWISKFTFRPDKDLHRLQYLHWNSAELLQLAARRLQVYLSLWAADEYEAVKGYNLARRDSLKAFWRRYLPESVENSIGRTEDSITYILRHTHMLPRQLISVLNAICARTIRAGRLPFQAPFSDHDIVKGIEDTEEKSVAAVLFMFSGIYPEITDMFSVVMPRLYREFTYGHLQSVWQSSAKPYMERMRQPDFPPFWQLMLATGAIGLKTDDISTEIYSGARFEFHTKYSISISDKDVLCVHPMFSRIYNLEKSDDMKLILPRGSDFMVDWG